MENTVELFVEYHDPVTDDIDYGVLFAGYMTRRFLYLVKTSVTGNPKTDAVSYVKVAKADTEIATDAASLSDPDEIRFMKVSTDDGIFDTRIRELSTTNDNEIIANIAEAITQLKANVAKVH